MAMTFCPQCGRKLALQMVDERERPVCSPENGGCGYIDFGQYSLGVGGLVVAEIAGEKRILLIERNSEPNRGGWTIPGGFVEWDETAQVGAVREVEEETGIKCELVGLVGFRSRADPAMNNSYAIFLLRAIGGKLVEGPTNEIAHAGFYSLKELDDLPRLAPLSRTLATAALTGQVLVLHAVQIAGVQKNQPITTLFMG
jgi:ADP-ribose pyrophosphatase YjhB (NUDIX family)